LADIRESRWRRRGTRRARRATSSELASIPSTSAARSALKAAQAASRTFKQAAHDYIAAHASGWKNAKHCAQWTATLTEYAYPVIGKLPVREIELAHIIRVLDPIWQVKTETAARVRGRMERVLDWATVHGYRSGLNPARWRGNLDALLPAPAKLIGNEHHAALALSELGAFMRELRQQEGIAARALEFTILSAARSGEVRGALWGEVDLDAKVWTIPQAGRKGSVSNACRCRTGPSRCCDGCPTRRPWISFLRRPTAARSPICRLAPSSAA
jgi:integrase